MSETLRDGRISVYLKKERKQRLLHLCSLLNLSASKFTQRAIDNEIQRITNQIVQEASPTHAPQ